LLGRLFRYDSEQMARKELLIFLTPQVICSPSDSDQQKEVEVARTHFPIQDAMQIHSQQPGPPEPIQPPGPRFPRAERREMRVNQRANAFNN
jgi:type II secretory pathway component GspD/PulD (secretin)